MIRFRQAAQDDLEAFYAISLATGLNGGDASHLHDDPTIVGQIYSAPYLRFSAALCFVAEDERGVGGYVVGASDTAAFEARLERDWWPALRARCPEPDPAAQADWTADQRRRFAIHHPVPTPEAILDDYPAHLHMNLLPRLQGRRLGGKLLDLWLAAVRARGVVGAHLRTGPRNPRAMRFWQNMGFVPLAPSLSLPSTQAVWLGRRL